MDLTSIINSAIASAVIAATPVYSNEPMPVVMSDICYYLEHMHEPKVELPVLDVKYKGHWLSKEEYGSVISRVNDGSLASDEIRQYLDFVSLMRHRELLEFVAGYYKVDRDLMLRVINQESAFSIRVIGNMKEYGLGQFREGTAGMLMKRITNPDDDLYYPFVKKGDYKFKDISKDYRLNLILVGAKLRMVDSVFRLSLAGISKTGKDLASRVEGYGRSTRLKHLSRGKSRKFKFYRVGSRTRKRINKFWHNHEAESSDLIYLVYNGGSSAVANMFSDNIVTEVLIYNFTGYCGRKHLVDHFLSLYEGSQEVLEDGMEDSKKIELPDESSR